MKKYLAQVMVNGVRKTKRFATKREAEAWRVEMREALSRPASPGDGKTVADLLDRYEREVTPSKRTADWERRAIRRIASDDELACIKLSDLQPHHIAAWRDRRLAEMSGSAVNRQMNILSNALAIGRREWQWIDREITRDVRRPRSNPPRQRLPTDAESEAICHALGERGVSGRVRLAWLFALETGLRASEICRVRPEHVTGRVLTVTESKTEAGVRQVPLTTRAVEILGQVGGDFGLQPAQIDALFRKARKLAAVDDLHFHDSRAFALTRLAKVLTPLELAKVAGHKDMAMLIRVYYREDVATLVDKLD